MAAASNPSTTQRPAPGPEPDPSTFVKVRTTLPRRPLPPNTARAPILTERLTLRALVAEDLAALHKLRTQPEVMYWTAAGRPDRDADETRGRLEPFLPPRDREAYNFAICARESEGELIGIGGCHLFRDGFGWPEVGYMIRKEFWGRGLGTEFLRGWVGAWEGLEREEVEIEVDPRTVDGMQGEGGRVMEQLIAVTAEGNDKSQGVLGKVGFEWFTTWLAEDLIKAKEAPGSMIELPTYRMFFGGKGE
ncbi:GNAT domain-containing protein [Staphylotrichum tortipilum]|uniref:GNAT domain-containing protein n=1 Tax=Staphylotrichum tortipilum TaxID=2831512 RepID=A0AAN6RUB0_9PEZI|nr:GNAT domain-containing protein [Staphylotrichum longicolle]